METARARERERGGGGEAKGNACPDRLPVSLGHCRLFAGAHVRERTRGRPPPSNQPGPSGSLSLSHPNLLVRVSLRPDVPRLKERVPEAQQPRMCGDTVPTARLHAQPPLSHTLRPRRAQRRSRRASGSRAGRSTPGCEFLRQAALRFARPRPLAPLPSESLPPPSPRPHPQSRRRLRPVRVPDIPRRPGSHAHGPSAATAPA